MLSRLSSINIPRHVLSHSHSLCNNDECLLSLEAFYCDIVAAVEYADLSLPRIKHGISKPFWSSELNDAKLKSYDAHRLWIDNGSPRSGPIFLEKYRVSLDYKSLLRKSKAEHDKNLFQASF